MISLSVTTIVLLILVGASAGLLGARIGIGGGIVLVPVLVLAFDIDPKIAIATSLLAVIATSTAAGGATSAAASRIRASRSASRWRRAWVA